MFLNLTLGSLNILSCKGEPGELSKASTFAIRGKHAKLQPPFSSLSSNKHANLPDLSLSHNQAIIIRGQGPMFCMNAQLFVNGC